MAFSLAVTVGLVIMLSGNGVGRQEERDFPCQRPSSKAEKTSRTIPAREVATDRASLELRAHGGFIGQ